MTSLTNHYGDNASIAEHFCGLIEIMLMSEDWNEANILADTASDIARVHYRRNGSEFHVFGDESVLEVVKVLTDRGTRSVTRVDVVEE